VAQLFAGNLGPGGLVNRPVPTRERLLRFISPEPNTGCWLWMGIVSRHGYGTVPFNRAGKKTKWRLAHRLAYEEFKKPIPRGLHIDHLCRVRCCVNPDHLEPVTCAENLRRGTVTTEAARVVSVANRLAKTHCKRGHKYTPENVYRTPAGTRICRTCRQLCWDRIKRH